MTGTEPFLSRPTTKARRRPNTESRVQVDTLAVRSKVDSCSLEVLLSTPREAESQRAIESSLHCLARLSKRMPVRLHARGQNECVTPIILGSRQRKPIPQSIQQFGIDRVNPQAPWSAMPRPPHPWFTSMAMTICSRSLPPSTTKSTRARKPSPVCGKLRCFGSSSPSIRHTWWAPLPQSTPIRLKTFVISFSVSCYVVGWRTVSEPVLALVV